MYSTLLHCCKNPIHSFESLHQYHSPFCHQTHLALAAGSLMGLMLLGAKFCTVALLPYMGKKGWPLMFGSPVFANWVMYSCMAMATGTLETPKLVRPEGGVVLPLPL